MLFFFAFIDVKVRDFVQDNKKPVFDYFFKTANYGGDGLIVSSFWISLWGYGYLTRDSNLKDWGRSGIFGLAVSGISAYILKVVIGRERPFVNGNPSNFRPFNLKDEYQSLPSGHTSVAFSVAGVIWKRSENKFLRVSSLIYGLSVAGARVYLDRHWFSDVLLGAVVGFLSGYVSAGILK